MNLLIIQTSNDGTVARTFLSFTDGTEVENEDKATSRLYSECSYASSPDTPICKIVAEIMDDEGHVKKCEKWGSLPPVQIDNSEKQPNNAEEETE